MTKFKLRLRIDRVVDWRLAAKIIQMIGEADSELVADASIETVADTEAEAAIEDRSSIGMTPEQLRAHLKEIGWTQRHLAKAFGVSPRTVNRWATGAAAIPAYCQHYLVDRIIAPTLHQTNGRDC